MFKEYKLRLTMQNIITLESIFKKNFYEIMADFISGSVNLEALLQILKQSIMGDHITCDNDIYTLYDEYLEEGNTRQDLFMLVFEIIKHAGFFEDKEAEENNEIDDNDSTYPKKEENPTSTSMDGCFFSLRDKALECEMDEDKFWNSTYGEVVRYIMAYNNKLKADIKMSLRSAHLTADLVGVSVARLLDSDITFPGITEIYPELFEEEIKELEIRKKEEELIKIKESLANFAKYCVVKDKDDNNEKGE
jgi:hypothetical protein